jgi:hypothetical protein
VCVVALVNQHAKRVCRIMWSIWVYDIFPHYFMNSGPGSSVGIATGYGLDGPGIVSRWGRVFRTCPDRPWGQPNLLYNGYQVFPGGKERPGRDADPSPPSSAVVMKEQSYTSTPPMGSTACTVELYLYSPYGQCGLYRASVPVQ